MELKRCSKVLGAAVLAASFGLSVPVWAQMPQSSTANMTTSSTTSMRTDRMMRRGRTAMNQEISTRDLETKVRRDLSAALVNSRNAGMNQANVRAAQKEQAAGSAALALGNEEAARTWFMAAEENLNRG